MLDALEVAFLQHDLPARHAVRPDPATAGRTLQRDRHVNGTAARHPSHAQETTTIGVL